MKKNIILYSIIFYISLISTTIAKIYTNLIGYKPDSKKIFISDIPFDSFYVKDINNNIIYKGNFSKKYKNYSIAGIDAYVADFSSIKDTGIFYIQIKSQKSEPFAIKPNIYNKYYYKVLKGLFYQRCGMDLEPKFAGKFSHKKCHLNDAIILNEKGKPEKHKNTTGGWHDAGDFGKYSNNAAYTLGYIFLSYLLWGNKMQNDNTNIPESGNNIPDILDEAKYELLFLLKMQREDGAVYHKLTPKDYSDLIMPEDNTSKRYIMPVTSVSTASVGACFATASIIFKNFDSQFADTLLNRAKLAWSFMKKQKKILKCKNPPGVVTSGYFDDNPSDEFFWLASALFINNPDNNNYKTEIINYIKNHKLFSKPGFWNNMENFGSFLLLLNNKLISQSNYNTIINALQNYTTTLIHKMDIDPFGIGLDSSEYIWGSNLYVMDNGFILSTASTILKNKKLKHYAQNCINYMLGLNINKKIFITGSNNNEVKHPHHAQSIADNIKEPVPGLVIEGANKNLHDDETLWKILKPDTPPAKCYIDHQDSWASNENDINLSGAFIALIASFLN